MRFSFKILAGILIIGLFVIILFFIKEITPKLTNKVVNMVISPIEDQNFLQEEFKGISIKYEKDDVSSLKILKEIYPNVKKKLDELYGDNASDNFKIIIYGNEKDFNNASYYENLGGFYVPDENSIHIKSAKLMPKYKYEDLIVHEYTHYRTTKYLKEKGITEDEIPQWFNEGVSEVMANQNTYIDIDLIEVMEFKELDTTSKFYEGRDGDFDPYLQSYFGVKELVSMYGEDVIPEILLSSKDRSFYEAFQDITGTNIDKVLTSYLIRRAEVKDLIKQADDYYRNKDFKRAQETFLEVIQLEPFNNYAKQSLPHLLIKQGEFSEALNLLKEKQDLDVSDLQVLSELSLLDNMLDSIEYSEMLEEKIRINNEDKNYKSPLGEALRENTSDPVNMYIKLFEEDLITYEEIRSELKLKLKNMYPNDQRLQSIK
ncbi:hypothetical protein FZW96_21135 [Bacillus sp. BGMRC 2118]|nr:hypothetical protein FZW96_21135 [Bacillus sp. BGMRC 2118]